MHEHMPQVACWSWCSGDQRGRCGGGDSITPFCSQLLAFTHSSAHPPLKTISWAFNAFLTVAAGRTLYSFKPGLRGDGGPLSALQRFSQSQP